MLKTIQIPKSPKLDATEPTKKTVYRSCHFFIFEHARTRRNIYMSYIETDTTKKNSIAKKNATSKLVELSYAINIDEIEEETLIKATTILSDGIGVLLHGIDHHTVQVIAKYLHDQEPKNGVKVIGHNFNATLADAAFIYGCAIHSNDFEPMFLPPTHAVSPILAPLIAIAQKKKINGKTFLKAFIAGIQFEAGLREGARRSDTSAAINEKHFPFDKHGFHPPGTVGPLGSALASSIALGLTQDECMMAIGYAASRSSGISGNIGSMTKATHCGNAARSGLEAALLCSYGLTASPQILETGSGWTDVFGGNNFNFETLIYGMKNLSCFTAPGFAIKKWPAHTAMQVAINSALQLHKARHESGPIQIKVPVFKYCNRPFPKDTDEARFSFQYNVAVSLIDGKINDDSHSEEKLHSSTVQEYLSRIELVLDQDIPRDFGNMDVIISLDSGKSNKSDSWPGHWKTPMTAEDKLDKFKNCCSNFWDSKTAEYYDHLINNIATKDNLKLILEGLNIL